MKPHLLAFTGAVGLAAAIATPAAAWTIYKDHGSWVQIQCGGGSVRGIKQKSNGKWTDTAYNQNFSSFEAAARAACDGRGG